MSVLLHFRGNVEMPQTLRLLPPTPDSQGMLYFSVRTRAEGLYNNRVSSKFLGTPGISKGWSPWVRSRQEQLEADLESAWKQDPQLLLEMKATPEVHEKSERATK